MKVLIEIPADYFRTLKNAEIGEDEHLLYDTELIMNGIPYQETNDHSKILKIISGVSEDILKEREEVDDPREQLYLTYQSLGVHRVQKAISEAFERGDLR